MTQAEFTAALAALASAQAEEAQDLRRQAAQLRSKALSDIGRNRGPTLEPWRRQRLADAECEASRCEQLASRCQLRSERAIAGKLLLSSEENGDHEYLSKFGYALIGPARAHDAVVTS
jgi:hypothetical protein